MERSPGGNSDADLGCFSASGGLLGNEYFRETTETRPSLVIDAGGSVKVVGGIAYDPNKPPEAEKQPRSASELPPGLLSN